VSEKIKILTVDDNLDNILLIVKGLENYYKVDTAESGKAGLHSLAKNEFDLILLDVNMPEMDGYQTCELIRKSENNSNIPVIFVSALTSLDDKLKGYAAGAQDYVEKPVALEVLIQKIELAVKQAKQLEALDQQAKFATQTAMTAMSNNSELGIILNFMEISFQTDCNHDLLKAIVNAVSEYQIDCVVQIRTSGQPVHLSSSSLEPSQIECDLLGKAKNADRVVTLGKRGIFNTKRVSFLARNMPIEDQERNGRLIDHLAVIVVAADARCKHIELQEQKLGTRNKTLDSVVEIADEEIEKLQEQFLLFRKETKRIMSELHIDIEESLVEFKLSDEQEDHFYQILGQGERAMDELADWGVVVEESLDRIKSTVITAIENMD